MDRRMSDSDVVRGATTTTTGAATTDAASGADGDHSARLLEMTSTGGGAGATATATAVNMSNNSTNGGAGGAGANADDVERMPALEVAQLLSSVPTRVGALLPVVTPHPTGANRRRTTSEPEFRYSTRHPMDGATDGIRRSNSARRAEIEELEDTLQSDFTAGIIRYEQHGARATRLRKQLAATQSKLSKFLGLHELLLVDTWRACLVEAVGMMFYNFLHMGIVMGAVDLGAPLPAFDSAGNALVPSAARLSTVIPPHVYVTIGTAILVLILIFATAPASGGHFNPLVSLSAMLTGLMTPTRAVLYIGGQFLGGFVGAAAALGAAGAENPVVKATRLAGCYYPDGVTEGQGFVGELFIAMFMLFVIHNVAFDPQQFQVFGPVLAPVFLSIMVVLVVLAIPVVNPGVALNMGRCIPPGVIWGDTTKMWVYCVAQIVAAIIHAGYQRLVPHHHVEALEHAKKAD